MALSGASWGFSSLLLLLEFLLGCRARVLRARRGGGSLNAGKAWIRGRSGAGAFRSAIQGAQGLCQ